MPARILLTGRPRVGKTTALVKVVEMLRARGRPLLGFLAEEVRSEGERIGFDLVDMQGGRVVFARKGLAAPETMGPYGLVMESLEALCRRLEDGLSSATPETVLVIDEIGAMELRSPVFRSCVRAAFASPYTIIGVIQLRPGVFVDALKRRPDVDVLTVDHGDRDALPAHVMGRIERAIHSRP